MISKLRTTLGIRMRLEIKQMRQFQIACGTFRAASLTLSPNQNDTVLCVNHVFETS